MVNDLISDSLIRIKNGYMARHKSVELIGSKAVRALAELLVKSGYLEKVDKNGYNLMVTLHYENKKPVLNEVKIVSTPSVRIYVKKNNIPVVLGGLGTCVVSTPKGLMTGNQAKKSQLGGELICEIW
jgi:small subunit ribosomal protein S8